MPRQNRPPVNARREPVTEEEIETDIKFFESKKNGRLDEWIDRRITELQDRLAKLKLTGKP